MPDTLAGIDLGGDPVWLDRHTARRSRQADRPTIGGGIVIVHRPILAGVPITLDCYLTEADLAALAALRDQGAAMVLSLADESFHVAFVAADNALEHEPLAGWYTDPEGDDLHRTTLRLQTL